MYPGSPTCIITDEKILNSIPLDACARLDKVFLDDLSGKTFLNIPGVDPDVKAWCRAVFGLIYFGGIAGKNAMKELIEMRWRDIATAGKGYIRIPRNSGLYPVIIPPVVQLTALSLCSHLLRKHQQDIHQKAAYPEDGLVLPNRSQLSIKLTAAEILAWTDTFDRWLSCLCRSAQLNLSFPQFLQLSRALLVRRYSPAVAGTILGELITNPIPIEQIGITPVELLAKNAGQPIGIDPSAEKSNPRSPLAQKKPRNGPNNHLASIREEGMKKWELPLRRMVTPYTRSDKNSARQIKKAVLFELARYQMGLERKYNKGCEEPWTAFLERVTNDNPFPLRMMDLNALLAAIWMEKLIRRFPPNTCDSRLNDFVSFSRYAVFHPLWRIEPAMVMSIIQNLSLSTESRRHLADTMHQFFHFLRYELGLPGVDIPWWRFAADQPLFEQPILTGRDIGRLHSDIRTSYGEMHSVMIALIVGVCFGLRISEICALKIGDVYFSGTPTVFIWNSKGEFSRVVTVSDIPERVVQGLSRYLEVRKAETNNYRKGPFLEGRSGKHLSPRLTGRIFSELMQRNGIVIGSGGKLMATHGFRHSFANRLFLAGFSLVEISRGLGHKTMTTTMKSYLHTFVCRQYDQLHADKLSEQQITCSIAGLTEILGLGKRGTRYWVKRNIPQLLIAPKGSGISSQYALNTIIPIINREIVNKSYSGNES
jgi:integrase